MNNVLELHLQDLDKLGMINDQIAALQEQADAIKAKFKGAGANKYESALYTATVSDVTRNTVDYKAILETLKISTTTYQKVASDFGWTVKDTVDAKSFIEAKHTKTTSTVSMTVKPRTK